MKCALLVKKKLYIIGVYLPHKSSKLSNLENELAILEYCIMCEFKDSNYIIIGDRNCHFNSDFGPRCWNINSCSSHSASQVIGFLQRCSLTMIDTTEKCQGPNYTYRHEMGHISYIGPRPLCFVSKFS